MGARTMSQEDGDGDEQEQRTGKGGTPPAAPVGRAPCSAWPRRCAGAPGSGWSTTAAGGAELVRGRVAPALEGVGRVPPLRSLS